MFKLFSSSEKSSIDWKNIDSSEVLAEIRERSKWHRILIFKHSTRCSISATALNRLERQWQHISETKPEGYFLDLIRYRNLSDEIAFTFNVRHESPQALLIEDGKCIRHASHTDIDLHNFV